MPLCVSEPNMKEIVAFSLFYPGDCYKDGQKRRNHERRYLLGLLKNYRRVVRLLPGFVARVYLDDSVPTDVADVLHTVAANRPDFEVVEASIPELRLAGRRGHVGFGGTLLRFLALEERGACVAIRDCDRLVSQKDAAFLLDWVGQQNRPSLMRYFSSGYEWPLVGGSFACCRSIPIRGLLRSTFQHMGPDSLEKSCEYFVDQAFMRDAVWPLFGEGDTRTTRFRVPGERGREPGVLSIQNLQPMHAPKGNALALWVAAAARCGCLTALRPPLAPPPSNESFA